MLTKDDKKFIVDTITFAITKNNEIIDKKFSKLTTDAIDLFNATNSAIQKLDDKLSEKIEEVNKNLSEKIDDTNERIDKVFDHLSNDFESIEDHEKRIEKVEEKVFVTTTSS